MSPWKVVKERKINKMNRENQTYELVGVAILDYYELYQTFTYVNQESYRLDFAWSRKFFFLLKLKALRLFFSQFFHF